MDVDLWWHRKNGEIWLFEHVRSLRVRPYSIKSVYWSTKRNLSCHVWYLIISKSPELVHFNCHEINNLWEVSFLWRFHVVDIVIESGPCPLKMESIQLNKYETAPNCIQLNQNYMRLFIDLAEFTCFYQFLHDVIIKLFRRSKQNNFMITTCKNW